MILHKYRYCVINNFVLSRENLNLIKNYENFMMK